MRERIMNGIGFTLLAACFVISVGRILIYRTQPESTADGRESVTIRFAHWQLESGVRDALTALADEYMRLNPNVRVIQIPVPEKIYTNWLITQLVGGTPPDIIQIGIGATDERIARFFTPLSDLASSPNPYNDGTDLEGVELRNTLFDGMLGGYREALLEYYGVPISGYSIRMFYNLDLLEEITGSRNIPQTYREFIRLCEAVADHKLDSGENIVAIAGSKYNAPFLMARLFGSQTQKLNLELNQPGSFQDSVVRRGHDYLIGNWSLDSPEVRSGIHLMREVGKHMQPGFMQLLRDDATLLFVQGRALMICTGSWDATSIRQQASFPVGVGPVPLPSTEDPEFGEFTLGGITEAGSNAGVTFGLTKASEHPEVARDFLLFLASQPANQIWTNVSEWIPSVLGVEVNDEVEPFLPVVEGFSGGLAIAHESLADTARVVTTQMHVLVAPFGSEEEFVESIRPDYGPSILASLERLARTNRDAVRRSDTQLGATAWRAVNDSDNPKRRNRFDIVRHAMLMNDIVDFRHEAAIAKEPEGHR